MTAADHDMMGEDDAACRHAAIACVIGHWTADTAHQTACVESKGEVSNRQLYSFFIVRYFRFKLYFNSYYYADLTHLTGLEKPSPLLALCKSLSKQQVEQMCWGQQNPPPGLLVVPRSFRTQSSW